MSRYIDAEWEEKYWAKCLYHPTPDVTEDDIKHAGAIIDALRMAKTADVRENIHGEWVEDGYNNIPIVCSYCGEPSKEKTNYCSSCGAHMKGDK